MISDGTQTNAMSASLKVLFESDVISDGTQTVSKGETNTVLFESDVISEGTQTDHTAYGS